MMNLQNSKNVHFEKCQTFLIWKHSKNFQFGKFEECPIYKIKKQSIQKILKMSNLKNSKMSNLENPSILILENFENF